MVLQLGSNKPPLLYIRKPEDGRYMQTKGRKGLRKERGKFGVLYSSAQDLGNVFENWAVSDPCWNWLFRTRWYDYKFQFPSHGPEVGGRDTKCWTEEWSCRHMATKIINHIILTVNIPNTLNSSPKSQSHHRVRGTQGSAIQVPETGIKVQYFPWTIFFFF